MVHRKAAVLRIHLLIFFELKELVKLSLISKEFLNFVDPNRFIIDQNLVDNNNSAFQSALEELND